MTLARKRNLNLDIIRTLAVFLVLGRHIVPCPPEVSETLNSITIVWKTGGWIGVDLFLVLSGFLVSGLVFREYRKTNSFSAKLFLIRRGLKIYPAFYFFILITVLVEFVILQSKSGKPWRAVFIEILFLQNYFYGLWSHTWSLALEEHFYLILTTGCYFVIQKFNNTPKNPFCFVPKLFIGIAVFCFLARFFTVTFLSGGEDGHLYSTHLRIDSLMFGVLISYFFHFRADKFALAAANFKYLLIFTGILFLIPAFIYAQEKYSWISIFGLTLFYLGSGAMIIGFYSIKLPNWKILRFTAYLGSNSYSVYLWHMIMGVWIIDLLKYFFLPRMSWQIYAAFYLIGSWVVGILMAKIIEIPILKLRDTFFQSRTDGIESDVRTMDDLLPQKNQPQLNLT